MIKYQYRTHTCSNLHTLEPGTVVKISGWLNKKRDHGKLLFVDLRDYTGNVQCVTRNPDHIEILGRQNIETVVSITGIVKTRPNQSNNKTESIELTIEHIEVVSQSEIPPFDINAKNTHMDLRLKYRFLDLRSSFMQKSIKLRNSVIQSIHQYMQSQGFIEVHTPLLTTSSPEGARDFLVPSRTHPGKFYALPQAPQIFKQLLMSGGTEKYYQIAPCMRDEESRADRSPGVFYQLDFEIAFATQEEVFAVLEDLLKKIFTKFAPQTPIQSVVFPKIAYRDAIAQYASDKPDLRNPLKYTYVEETGQYLLPIPNTISTQDMQALVKFVQETCGASVDYWSDDKPHTGITNSAAGLIISGLSQDQRALVRTKVGGRLNLIDNTYAFCWIVDFPMYEFDEQKQTWDFLHNPFSMPQNTDLDTQHPSEALAYQYDIVCNGIELSSGAVRNYNLELMAKIFQVAGHSKETLYKMFPALTTAFKFGTPPHAGCAPGIERILMLLLGTDSIKDVIPFPLNSNGTDPMMDAPCTADPKSLEELHIQIKPAKKNKLSQNKLSRVLKC